MPPHCDTRDGPVARACITALQTGNVNHALIWIRKEDEPELRRVFDRVMKVRSQGKEAREIADDWLFETAVRLHRAGEGAAYTGLKPAGLDEGPVVPLAEKAIESGDGKDAIGFVVKAIDADLRERFERVVEKKHFDPNDVEAGRAFVAAFIDYVVWSHHLYVYVKESGENGHRDHETPT